MPTDFDEFQTRQQQFLETREWGQFHTPKSIAMALSVEVGELMKRFQWHDNLPAEAYDDYPEIRKDVEEELADILIYAFSMAAVFDIDLAEAVNTKVLENEERFDDATAAAIREDLSTWAREDTLDSG